MSLTGNKSGSSGDILCELTNTKVGILCFTVTSFSLSNVSLPLKATSFFLCTLSKNLVPPHPPTFPLSRRLVLVWNECAATTAEQAGAIHYHTATTLQKPGDTETYGKRERERGNMQDMTEVRSLSSVILRSIIHRSLSN